MKKHGVWAVIGILGLMLAVTLAFPTEGICASKPSTLKMGWSEGPQAGMNPFLARNEGDYVFMSLLYEPLVIPLMTGEITPWLAKSWEYNAAENAWVFHLDERATWSDGTPVTAEDVKFTFEHLMDPATKSPFAGTYKSKIARIEILDPYRMKFTLHYPTASFLTFRGRIWSTKTPAYSTTIRG